MRIVLWVFGESEDATWEWDFGYPFLPRVGDEVQFLGDDEDEIVARVKAVTWHMPDDEGDEVWVSVAAYQVVDDPHVEPVSDPAV